MSCRVPTRPMRCSPRPASDLQAQDAELLYWCVGRECGSSSLWANAVFANATLYRLG